MGLSLGVSAIVHSMRAAARISVSMHNIIQSKLQFEPLAHANALSNNNYRIPHLDFDNFIAAADETHPMTSENILVLFATQANSGLYDKCYAFKRFPLFFYLSCAVMKKKIYDKPGMMQYKRYYIA